MTGGTDRVSTDVNRAAAGTREYSGAFERRERAEPRPPHRRSARSEISNLTPGTGAATLAYVPIQTA